VLVAQGYRVLAIEGPGHGRSPGKQASPWLFAQALLAAQAEFGAPDAVVGHSLGGGAVPIALAHGLRARRVATLGAPAAMSEITENFLKAVGVSTAARSELRRLMDEHGGRPMRELDPEVLAADMACKTAGAPDDLLAERLALTIAGRARRLGL
jgi:pimeloyl-ACP methyl ester carboxylesterase